MSSRGAERTIVVTRAVHQAGGLSEQLEAAGLASVRKATLATQLRSGEAVMRTEARVPFRGWKIATFTAYGSVREQVNAVLALEIMGFAILMAFTFYLLSRRAWSRRAGSR